MRSYSFYSFKLWKNGSLPTCGCRQGDGCAPFVPPLCSQGKGVAHPRSQIGQMIGSRCSWEPHLPNLTVSGDVHQSVSTDFGLRFLPLDAERRLCGFNFLKISGRIEVWQKNEVDKQLISVISPLNLCQHILSVCVFMKRCEGGVFGQLFSSVSHQLLRLW